MFTSMEFISFINRMKDVSTEDALHDILGEFTRWLGFEWFAMGHHVDLVRPPSGAIRITNYDRRWIDQVSEQGYFIDDPIHAASMRTVTGFRWNDLPAEGMSERQRMILANARQYGLVAGYTVPIYLPGEYAGTCTFAGPSFEHLRPFALELSDVVAAAAFECARRILQIRDKRIPAAIPRLAPREREALVLVGRGKTDAEIGTIMGITTRTAHSYIENVRFAYGHLPRPSLVIRALFDNQFAFADAFRR